MSEYAVMPIEDYKNTCDKVREKTGSEDAIKSGELAGEVENVFEAGIDEGVKQMWSALQGKGAIRSYYEFTFEKSVFSKKMFAPQQTIKPSYSAQYMFRYATVEGEPIDAVEYEKEHGFPVFDFSTTQRLQEAFRCNVFSRVGTIDLSKCTGTSATYMVFSQDGFSNRHLKCIEKIIVSENTVYNLSIYNCTELTKCIFEGVIGKNGLRLNQSPKLDYESLVSVTYCLKDYSNDTSGTIWRMVFGPANLAKLKDEDKARMTAKGWAYE